MSGYAIFRAEGKYKAGGALRGKHSRNMSDLAKAIDHIQRTGSPVLNAKTPYDSRHVAGNFDLLAGINSCLPAERKKDAVLAVEIVLTTSPESLRFNDDKTAALDPEKLKKFESAAQKFIKRWGGCAHLRAHYDEKTPHYQGFIVPNEGFIPGAPLNAKKMLGPAVMEDYQTEWAEMLQAEGLDVKRGEPGSQAEYEPLADYYARVNAPNPSLPPVPAPVPGPSAAEKIQEAMGVETDRLIAQKARSKAIFERNEATHDQRITYAAKAAEFEAKNKLLLQRSLKSEAKLVALKTQTAQLRALPLADVLRMFGCEQTHDDKQRWMTPAGDVWIDKNDGARFNSFDDEKLKGVGAIDLVMKINGSSFADSVSWLASRYGVEATTSDAAKFLAESAKSTVLKVAQTVLEPAMLPMPAPSRLEAARAYLVEIRRIPVLLVNRMIEQGKIYADRFANVCFLTDTKTGVEMRGTAKPKNGVFFRGHRGLKTGFTVLGNLKKVAIVESAIEALSCHTLNGMTAVSVGGSNAKKAAEIAKSWIAKGATVFAAQNADAAGEKQATALMQSAPGVHRLKPVLNDWNDDLRSSQEHKLTEEKSNSFKPS